jgi:hypothetical protein
VWEVVGAVFVSETDNASALAFSGAKVMQGLTILVKMSWHLTIMAGVAAAMAGQASRLGGRRHTSFETERTHLFQLMLTLAKLWILPYKGLEAAMSIYLDQACPYLLLVLRMFPLLMFVAEPLLSGEGFEGFDMPTLSF